MKRTISPTLIGTFVVGAVVLLVTAIALFGSARYFRKTREFVLYFRNSVNGLRVGAPVKFRGVEVGSVEDIRLRLESDLEIERIPVIVEIDPKKITSRGGTEAILEDPKVFKDALDRGLRAQLQVESFVTGQLFVSLDFIPGSPLDLVQQPGGPDHRYREVPTLRSSLEKTRSAASHLVANLAEVDFRAFMDSAGQAVQGINQLVNSPDLRRAVRSIDQVTGRLDEAATNVSKLAATLEVAARTLSSDVQVTTADARDAIKQITGAVSHAEGSLRDSPTIYELNHTLQEISAAARSLRLLSGYVERNPRALIFGRPAAKEQ